MEKGNQVVDFILAQRNAKVVGDFFNKGAQISVRLRWVVGDFLFDFRQQGDRFVRADRIGELRRLHHFLVRHFFDIIRDGLVRGNFIRLHQPRQRCGAGNRKRGGDVNIGIFHPCGDQGVCIHLFRHPCDVVRFDMKPRAGLFYRDHRRRDGARADLRFRNESVQIFMLLNV